MWIFKLSIKEDMSIDDWFLLHSTYYEFLLFGNYLFWETNLKWLKKEEEKK